MTTKERLTDIPNRPVESVSQSTTEDGASTEAAWRIAEGLGVRADTCLRIVDSYGADHALAAFEDVQAQIKAGKQIRSPIGVMVANLRSGAVQVKVAEVDPAVDFLQRRYHRAQSNPMFDTAAKKLARDCGYKTVRCVCCGQEFASEVT